MADHKKHAKKKAKMANMKTKPAGKKISAAATIIVKFGKKGK